MKNKNYWSQGNHIFFLFLILIYYDYVIMVHDTCINTVYMYINVNQMADADDPNSYLLKKSMPVSLFFLVYN